MFFCDIFFHIVTEYEAIIFNNHKSVEWMPLLPAKILRHQSITYVHHNKCFQIFWFSHQGQHSTLSAGPPVTYIYKSTTIVNIQVIGSMSTTEISMMYSYDTELMIKNYNWIGYRTIRLTRGWVLKIYLSYCHFISGIFAGRWTLINVMICLIATTRGSPRCDADTGYRKQPKLNYWQL